MARMPNTDAHGLARSADRFSLAFPALAGALGARSDDASLERVREGLFYLGATVVDRIRELESDGHRAIAEAVAPDLLRPFPAATIVELAADGVCRIPAGAEVRTSAPSSLRFRTTGERTVGPWRVEEARIERQARDADVLVFDLVATGPLARLADCVGDGVPLFLSGPREPSLLLLAHLLSHARHVELLAEDGWGGALGPIRPFGAAPEEALAPDPDGPHTGLSLLRDYFVLPEKFCFFELRGVATVLEGSAARRATVTIELGEPLPAQAAVTRTGIRAHCVPAVNLFRATAEPWLFEPGRAGARVRVASSPGQRESAYAVLGASAIARDDLSASPVPLPAARRFGAGAIHSEFPYAYSVRSRASVDGGKPDWIMALTSPRGSAPCLAAHVVSADLLATNGQAAGALRPGDLCEAGPGMPAGARARNIVPSSPYVPVPTGTALALEVAARAAVSDGDPLFSLQSTLHALTPRRGVDPAVARGHAARVAAIERAEVTTVADRARATRGYELRIAVDETPFQGLGDVALFLRVLQVALEAQVSAGHFYRGVATCTKGGSRLRWPPAEAP